MIDDTTAETASLYVFDLLEPGDARAFAQRLKGDSELRTLVDQLTATAAALTHTAPSHPLPAGLEARVLAAIRSEPKIIRFPASRRRAVASWLGWAIAACLAVVAARLWHERADLRSEVASLRDRDELNQVRIASLTSKIGSAPDASAIVLWDQEKQRGVIRTKRLPAPPADHDYQLWVVDESHPHPVDGGIFPAAKEEIDFRPGAAVTVPKAFAVSLEKKGGVPIAEGPMVLVGQ